MSSSIVENVTLPENIVRDISWTHDGTAVNLVIDAYQMYGMVGLDVFIRNRGAAAITIAFDGKNAVTIDPGDVYTRTNTKFWLVTVTAAVIYDFEVAGVKVQTLKRRGLI